MPHDAVDAGSLKVGMNLIRLKEPVLFGDEESVPVRFVCCLSAVDHDRHLKAFFHLVNLLQAVDDILVDAGILADDNYCIVAGHDGSRVYYDKQNPRTEIGIEETAHDEAE